jgi:hypothetical protein
VDDLNAKLGGTGGYRRGRQHSLAADRRVRPGQDCNYLETCFNERIQGRNSDGGGPREKDPHPLAPTAPAPKLDPEAAPPKLEPTVLARFAVVRSVTES